MVHSRSTRGDRKKNPCYCPYKKSNPDRPAHNQSLTESTICLKVLTRVSIIQTLYVTSCNTYLAQLFIPLLLETPCTFLTLSFQSVCGYYKSTCHHGALRCKYYAQIFKFVSITEPDNSLWPPFAGPRCTQFLLHSITRLCEDSLLRFRALAYCSWSLPTPSAFANSSSLAYPHVQVCMEAEAAACHQKCCCRQWYQLPATLQTATGYCSQQHRVTS